MSDPWWMSGDESDVAGVEFEGKFYEYLCQGNHNQAVLNDFRALFKKHLEWVDYDLTEIERVANEQREP